MATFVVLRHPVTIGHRFNSSIQQELPSEKLWTEFDIFFNILLYMSGLNIVYVWSRYDVGNIEQRTPG